MWYLNLPTLKFDVSYLIRHRFLFDGKKYIFFNVNQEFYQITIFKMFRLN